MFFSKYATSAVAILAATFVAAQTQVQTPASLVECLPAQITWTGGVAPYFLSIIPGGQPGSTPLVDLGSPASSPYTWSAVNVTSGTSVTVSLRDGSGVVYYSAAVTVQPGSSTSCIGSGAAAAPVAASSSATVLISSAASAISSASSAASSAAASASSAVSSAAAGASSMASSAAAGASSKASSMSMSMSMSGSNTATRASSTPSTAASTSSGAAGKLEATGLFAVLLAAVGAIAI